MGTFVIIFLIISLVGGLLSRSRGTVNIKSNSNFKKTTVVAKFNQSLYEDLPEDIRKLIEFNQYFELAEVMVRLEKNKNSELVERLSDAIKYKNPRLYIQVENVRQNLRLRNNLK